MGNPIEQGYTRRDVLIKGAELFGMTAFLSACRGQQPPQPPHSTRELGTPIPTKKEPTAAPFIDREIDPAHLNAILETLKNTGDPLLAMISDHIKTLRSSPQLPIEFPSWVSKNSKPARIVVTEGTASQALFSTTGNKDPKTNFLIAEGNNNPIKQEAILATSLDGIILAIPDYVRAGGLLEEGIYLAKEHLTQMMNLRFAQEFFDVGHGRFFQAREFDANPVTDPSRKETIGMTAFNLFQSRDRSIIPELWDTADALPTYLLASRIATLEQKKVLDPQRNKLPAIRVAREKVLVPNPGISVTVDQIVLGWTKAGTFLPPVGTTAQVFTFPIMRASAEFQTTQLPNNRQGR